MRRLGLVLAFLLLPLAALAQNLPQPASDAVNDFGNLLSDAAEARLVAQLKQARAETGVHVVLVTMDRREAYGGEGRSIEDYAKRLFNAWGVGDAKRNDGILILVAKDDREMRIQLGSGFGSEWDGVAQGVISSDFLPAFRSDRYESGIERGTGAVISRIARPFAQGQKAPVYAPPPASSTPRSRDSSGSSEFSEALLIPFMLFVAALLALRNFIGDFMVRMKPCPQCGKKGLRRTRRVLVQATRMSSGEGEATTTCDFCDYRLVMPYVIPQVSDNDNDRGSGSSSGSSGGFGGGRSSGGGATGRW